MDITNARTVALNTYHNSYERQIDMVAIAAAGFTLLKNVINVPNAEDLMGRLIDSVGGTWGYGRLYPEPHEKLEDAFTSFSNSVLVMAFSAFDKFLTDFLFDLSEFSETVRSKPEFEHEHSSIAESSSGANRNGCCNNKPQYYAFRMGVYERFEFIIESLEIDFSSHETILPLLHYFWAIRNRIVHSNAVANQGLVDISNSSDLNSSIHSWNSICRKPIPGEMPRLVPGQIIALLPWQASLGSAVCYTLAKKLDTQGVRLLGEPGLAQMGAFYGLLASDYERLPGAVKSPVKAIRAFMDWQLNIKEIEDEELISLLRLNNLWKPAVRRFREIYE